MSKYMRRLSVLEKEVWRERGGRILPAAPLRNHGLVNLQENIHCQLPERVSYPF